MAESPDPQLAPLTLPSGPLGRPAGRASERTCQTSENVANRSAPGADQLGLPELANHLQPVVHLVAAVEPAVFGRNVDVENRTVCIPNIVRDELQVVEQRRLTIPFIRDALEKHAGTKS